MGIEDFRKQFIDDIRNDASIEGSAPESYFIERALTDLEEFGELSEPIPMSVKVMNLKRQILSFDGYAYDEANRTLVLIASEYINQCDLAHTLTNTRIEELLFSMQRFIDESVNGDLFRYCNANDSAYHIAKEFGKKINDKKEIERFKFVVISNCTLSKQIKSLKRPDFLGRPVELKVWSLENFFNEYNANSHEVVKFETSNFGCNGIQCLKAKLGEECNDTYLCVVPGLFLADLYIKYSNNLLQKHVRGALGIYEKVSKAVRNSAIHRPEKFFELNNGIVAVAREVKLDTNCNIIAFNDFQILNGCQTVVTLAKAVLKNETSKLEDLFVPMKLIVFNLDTDLSREKLDMYDFESLEISKCTQNQQPTRDTDFFSNHPFHILMELLSRKVFAPSTGGNPYQTKWFYERHRRGWYQEQIAMNIHQISIFLNIYPKHQVISKEKFARCYNTILMHPDQVCKGASVNLRYFAPTIEMIYSNRDCINEDFYKKCICSVIMYESLANLIEKASWYKMNDNKSQLVPYTISKLMSSIPSGKDLNWNLIWKKQELYPEIKDELMKLALFTYEFMKQKAGRRLVRDIAKQSSTWSDYRTVSYELSGQFLSTLINNNN